MVEALTGEFSTLNAERNFPFQPHFAVLDPAGHTGFRFDGILTPASRACLFIPDISPAEAAIDSAWGNKQSLCPWFHMVFHPMVMSGSQPFNDRGGRHAMTNAHGLQSVTAFAALQFMQELGHQNCPGGTEWMPVGNGTAVRINLAHIRH